MLKYFTFVFFKRTKRNANCIRHLLNPFENRQETSMAKPPLFRRLSVVLKAIGTPRMPWHERRYWDDTPVSFLFIYFFSFSYGLTVNWVSLQRAAYVGRRTRTIDCGFKWSPARWQARCFSGGLTSGSAVLEGPPQISIDFMIRL